MSDSDIFAYVLVFILGTMIGSFANVCMYRLPWGQSLLFPGSHCPHCQQPVRPWHNVPLLSYIWLKARCASCYSPISWRYPLVEGVCGVLYVVLYHHFGVTVQGAINAVLVTVLLIVTGIDAAHQIIPDVITLPGILLGLLTSWLLTPVGLGDALLGMLIGGGVCLVVAVLSRGGMGGGDIKLAAMLGAFLGWQAVCMTIVLGALLGALVGLGLIVANKKGRKDPLPFGPFLALGALIAILWEQTLVHWYLGSMP